nr:hypothetical protein [Propionibacterium sp.]
MNINPFLALLALVAGFLYSWQFVVVKRVTRDAPVPLDPADADADAADADLTDLDHLLDGEGDAAAPGPAPEAPAAAAGAGAASGLARQAREWLARLDEAKDRLVGSAGRAEASDPTTEPEPEPGLPRTRPGQPATWTDAPADGSTPAGFSVKGDRKAQLYLAPDDPDYDRARPDIWFVDERAALAAGYSHYVRRPKGGAG